MSLRYVNVSAALLGGIFLFWQPIYAAVPVLQSQADHIAANTSGNTTAQAGPDPALLESLVFQLQQLQNNVASQRGLIEELNFQLEQLQQEQRQRYIDLDKRIQQLSQQQAVSPKAPSVNNENAVGTVNAAVDTLAVPNDQGILAQYQAAKDLMLEKRFDESIAQLAIFAKTYPEHPYSGNAWYWIGEIYLVQRKISDALQAFERIVNNYDNHNKVPDSLYKLGVIAQQNSQLAKAEGYFKQVIAQYPNTQSAKLSQARLNNL